MKPETGTTIRKILEHRVPLLPTALLCTDGTVYEVSSLGEFNRDIGDEFDRFEINFAESNGDHREVLYTSDIKAILDPIEDRMIFEADQADSRREIPPYDTRKK